MVKAKKISKEIRLQIKDEASEEVLLNEYLHDRGSCPYGYREMIMLALKAFWLPFAYKRLGVRGEELRKATIDSIYQLQMHVSYLHSQIGFELEGVGVMVASSISPGSASTSNTSAPNTAVARGEDTSSLPELVSEDEALTEEWHVPFEFTNKLG